jgi:hypothetical protein
MPSKRKVEETIELLNAKLRFIVGICLAFTLTGTIFAVLYSLIHVTQPMYTSPNDEKFFELIQPIATFLTGTLSGIMLSGGIPVARRKEDEDDDFTEDK